MIKVSVKNNKVLIGIYFIVGLALLITIVSLPILVRHDQVISRHLVIEEDLFEALMIFVLLGISFLIRRGFRRRLTAYRLAVVHYGEEQSKWAERLSEAFHYIGSVNVELGETMTALCSLRRYPFTHNEMKQQIHQLSNRIMTIADAPWVVVRIVHRCSGRTIKEYASARPGNSLPTTTIGNRAILGGHTTRGLKMVCSCQTNLQWHTAMIFPAGQLSKEELLLITAMVNQIEMLFLLFERGGLRDIGLQDFTNSCGVSEMV